MIEALFGLIGVAGLVWIALDGVTAEVLVGFVAVFDPVVLMLGVHRLVDC